MKIIILTTLTPHHIYFVKKVSEHFGIHTTILEKESLVPPFNTYHSFEKEREQYERKELLQEENFALLDMVGRLNLIELTILPA